MHATNTPNSLAAAPRRGRCNAGADYLWGTKFAAGACTARRSAIYVPVLTAGWDLCGRGGVFKDSVADGAFPAGSAGGLAWRHGLSVCAAAAGIVHSGPRPRLPRQPCSYGRRGVPLAVGTPLRRRCPRDRTFPGRLEGDREDIDVTLTGVRYDTCPKIAKQARLSRDGMPQHPIRVPAKHLELKVPEPGRPGSMRPFTR